MLVLEPFEVFKFGSFAAKEAAAKQPPTFCSRKRSKEQPEETKPKRHVLPLPSHKQPLRCSTIIDQLFFSGGLPAPSLMKEASKVKELFYSKR